MITLYAFGPAFGQPDASPFVTKAHVLLKMAGQPYRVDTQGIRKAPKGKLPYIDDAGTLVADSTFIRWHLEKKYAVDFDAGLTHTQRATAWAVEKLLEDNLYWIAVHERWAIDSSFRQIATVYFKSLPLPVRGLVARLVRRHILKSLKAQGMGRHDQADLDAIAERGVETLSQLLGDKPFLMGEQPCSADAMLFGVVASALCPQFNLSLRQAISRYANLASYEARMRERFFSAEPATT